MKKMMFTTAVLAAAMAFSCNDNGVLEPISFENSIISFQHGDTLNFKRSENTSDLRKFYDSRLIFYPKVLHDTVMRFTGVKLHGAPIQAINLDNLKNKNDASLKGKPLEYVAIGSSLTAGIRDGGYYNEAILTAYPELIARQMKLVNFRSPVFEPAMYNGIGRQVKTNYNPTQGPIQKMAVVTNNTAVVSFDENQRIPVLSGKKLLINSYNNLAIPGLYFSGNIGGDRVKDKAYLQRFENFKINDVLKNKPIDFFTFEAGSADFFTNGFLEAGAIRMSPVEPGEITRVENLHQYFLKLAKEKGMKGVVIGTPNHLKFPGWRQVSCGLMEKNSNNVLKNTDCYDGFLIGSSLRLDSLASPVVNINIKTANMSYWAFNEQGQAKNNVGPTSKFTESTIKNFNDLRKKHAEGLGFPYLDMDGIYDKILAGSFITDDGVKVNPDWKTGNFFSQDGIFPTAFGHAVIANEILKVVNVTYKTNIPLIPTKEYLK